MTDQLLCTFFIIIPPGLEQLASQELIEKTSLIDHFPYKILSQEKGGLTLESPLLNGLSLNYLLKIPTRILLRVGTFKCRDFPKLYKKVTKVKWSDYLCNEHVDIMASSKNSRMINTAKIKSAINDGVIQYFKANTPSKNRLDKIPPFPPTLFARIIDDEMTLSIDTTGERLNLRNYKTHVNHAPIRENLASALIYTLRDNPPSHLIDPMCGSGTFLLEAINFYKVQTSRSFAFESFSLKAKPLDCLTTYREKVLPFISVTGMDINPKNLEISQLNWLNLQTNFKIALQEQDIFCKSSYCPKGLISILLNPPYGKRMAIKDEPLDYFSLLFKAIIDSYHPNTIGIIIPAFVTYKKIKPEGYKLVEVISFSNGGIKVNFLHYEKRPEF